MDEWNRFPIDGQQPESTDGDRPVSQQPSANEQPTPAAEQPSGNEPPASPTPPVPPASSYGWNPTPYAPPPKKRGSGTAVAVILGAVCVVILGVLAFLLVMAQNTGKSDTQNGTSTTQPTTTNATVSRDPNDLPTLTIPEENEVSEGLSTRQIVSDNLDSTVLLTIYTKTASGSFGQAGTEQETAAGFASGFVLSEDGYIATNWHCVINENTNEPYARVDVTMYDGTVYQNAVLVGADSSTDLAVIKVDATGLQAAKLGNSDALQLGDRVIALGNAGGLGFSATEGILSGLARDVYEDTGYAIKCFQVDAAINPGNSGGPLFNAMGQVIAVNSAKIVAEGYEGLGFSIPINEAVKIFDDLMKHGYVTGRVALGVTGRSYDDGYYAGFLIYSVEEGSPLKDTGVQQGDLITAINDTAVTNYSALRSALSQHKVGDTVKVTLMRATNRHVESFEVEIVLTESKG